MSTPEEPG